MSSSTASSKTFDEMEFIDFVSLLVAYRWRVVISTVFFTVLFTAAAFYKTPVYRVTTVLIPAGSDKAGGSLNGLLGQLGGIASLAGVSLGGSNSNVEEALAVLRSREFTEKFIDRYNLLPVLYEKGWDVQKGQWKAANGKAPTLAQGSRYFEKRIRSIVPDKKTGLVSLNVDWRDAKRAAEWARLLIGDLNEEMRQRALANADRYIEYLQKELTVTPAVETREAINRLLEAQIKQRMIASVTTEYAFRVVDKGMAPERDDFIRPNRLLWTLSGFGVGLLGGIISIMVTSLKR